MARPAPIPEAGKHVAEVTLDRVTWGRFVTAVRAVATSEVGLAVRLLFVALLLLMLGINGVNVLNSYVGRDFMTAIERRSMPEFVAKALLYVGVFAASTLLAVIFRFIEERLGLLWRAWLSGRLVDLYLQGGTYLHLKERGEVDNPDQRIADDIRAFTTTTLSLVLMWLNGTFTIVAFSSVLWSISPLLFLVAVGYAGVGSALTVVFGRPLVRLNYDQADREASFRAELVHVRENAESVALLQREGRLAARLLRRLGALVANTKRIIAVNRNVSFFTTGYSYGIQIIPALIVGPLFIRGDVEFGVITQSAMAFSHLLGAFSLVVTQFGSLSSYAAVLARLSNLVAAVEEASAHVGAPIESAEQEERLVFDDLTLRSRRDGRVLVGRLNVELPRGTRLLVTGPEEAQVALFRALAGLWEAREGRIVRPPAGRILFLPERPYLPPGTLREVIVRTGQEGQVADAAIAAVLDELGLEALPERVGGLDVERDWDDALSLREQQLVAVARVRLAAPAFTLLQSPSTTLGPEQVARCLGVLGRASITYVVFGGAYLPPDAYDAVLEIGEDGAWTWQPSRGSRGARDRRGWRVDLAAETSSGAEGALPTGHHHASALSILAAGADWGSADKAPRANRCPTEPALAQDVLRRAPRRAQREVGEKGGMAIEVSRSGTPANRGRHADIGEGTAGNGRRLRLRLLVGALALAALGAAAYGFFWLRQTRLPPGFASGNGRIEATEYDIATKRAGRVEEVTVHEGDLVQEGQVLAQMDIDELTAQRLEAEAELQRARKAQATAEAVLVQRESELEYARIEHRRAQKLVERQAAPIERLDRDRTRREAAEAAVHAAQEQLNEAKSAIAAAGASLHRIETLLDESSLVSPIRGRVIYRLAEPGEVLDAGGKVVTILDLADVYMTIFLPTEQAGRVGYGAEARMVLDALPDFVLPASVSFVSPEAQFTPKEVETRTEREKLMFRIKVKIDPALLEQHLEQVKTGIPGVSYIRLAGAGEWPEHLAVRLPPE